MDIDENEFLAFMKDNSIGRPSEMIYSAIGVCKCKNGKFHLKFREMSYECHRCNAYYRVSLADLEVVNLDPKLVLVFKAIAPWIEVT